MKKTKKLNQWIHHLNISHSSMLTENTNIIMNLTSAVPVWPVFNHRQISEFKKKNKWN